MKNLEGIAVCLTGGLYALYLAYKGVWKPGTMGSRHPPVKQEWPARMFAVFIGLFFLFGAAWLLMNK